jgi:hypothetical protein
VARKASIVIALGCAAAVLACADEPAQATKAPATPSGSAAAKPSSKTSRSKATKRRAKRSSHADRIATPSDAAATPAVRYGALSQDDCEAELTRRHIEFVREEAAAVLAPVRLSGALHGVVFRTDQSAEARATSRWEIADCRLVLALDDFAEILSRYSIVEVRHYSMYRPPRSARTTIGTQHDGALAIDAGRFIDATGAVLDVDKDFHGRIGDKTCGDGAAPRAATPEAIELRAILCEVVERHLFNVVLTPNYNRPHKNHFHLEVMADVSWFLVH